LIRFVLALGHDQAVQPVAKFKTDFIHPLIHHEKTQPILFAVFQRSIEIGDGNFLGVERLTVIFQNYRQTIFGSRTDTGDFSEIFPFVGVLDNIRDRFINGGLDGKNLRMGQPQ
jgi:hypothetical protein